MSNAFKQLYDKDRRLAMLRFLKEAPCYQLNASVLKTGLETLGHIAPRDVIEADLIHLESHALVTLERIPVPRGEVIVATLTKGGVDVVSGATTNPIVARPEP